MTGPKREFELEAPSYGACQRLLGFWRGGPQTFEVVHGNRRLALRYGFLDRLAPASLAYRQKLMGGAPMLTRRGFLATSFAASAGRALPFAPLGLTLTPTQAKAEPLMAGLSAAATVVGMIAAHNRGDGGVGAYLNALNRKLDVAIDQLASLQSAVADVLVKLAALPGEIDALLREDAIRNLHDLALSSISSYEKLIAVRDANYRNDDEFRKATGVLDDVNSILSRLELGTAQLKQKRALGPTTVLVIPAAFHLEHSLLLLRGDRSRDIAARLQASVEWLDDVADPGIASSTAAYRDQAILRHDQYMKAAAENPVGKDLGMKPGAVPLECVGIDDYRPESWEMRLCREHGPIGFDGPSPENGSMAIPINLTGAGAWREAQMVGHCEVKVNERHGAHERMFQTVRLEEVAYEVEVGDSKNAERKPAGFRALLLRKDDPSKVLPANSREVPKQCAVESADMENASHRSTRMLDRLQKSPKQAAYSALAKSIEQINLERARIALATTSLTVAAKAKTDFAAAIKDLTGQG